MSAERTKKKSDPLTKYVAILRRVEQHAGDMRKCAEAQDRAVFELLHECGKKSEDCEDSNRPKDTEFEDMKEIHIPLAIAMLEGGDPFPAEWRKLRGALAIRNLPEIRDEAIRLHDSFVALFPTGETDAKDASQYRWQAIEEEAGAFAAFPAGLLSRGKEDCRMTIQSFAGKCGVSIRTVKNWNAGKGRPPTVFNPVLKQDVTYSPLLLDNPIEAERFAMLYKEHRRIKRAEREKVSYRGEETDRVNERQKRGVSPSAQQREADYNGVARDSDSARRLGYKSSVPSSWGK